MKLFIVYLMTIALGVGIFLGINHYALTLYGPEVINMASNKMSHFSPLGDVLIALVTVIVTARACGYLFKKINQPTVMGEVVGGIVLGPSLLGHFFPNLMLVLIAPTTLPYLNIIAQLGIVLYMFIVGLELNISELKKSAHSTFIISHSSILVPFVMGTILAFYIYQDMAPPGVGFTNFALFIGVSLSITAFPVLARILADKGITKTPIGRLALSCAAIDDVTAWCLLALVVSRVQSTMNNAFVTYALCALYILTMIFVLRPMLEKFAAKSGSSKMAFFLIGALISALITEAMGIHAIFGAFLFGVIIPSDSQIATDMDFKLQEFVRIFFLPAFFAYTGIKTQIGLLDTSADWLLCLGIIVVATVGKFGGTVLAAKFSKHTWKDSLVLGTLMNTRGLVELIALNVGLEIGIISPRLFTMLVIMAIATTFLTGPILVMLNKIFQQQAARS